LTIAGNDPAIGDRVEHEHEFALRRNPQDVLHALGSDTNFKRLRISECAEAFRAVAAQAASEAHLHILVADEIKHTSGGEFGGTFAQRRAFLADAVF